MAHWLPRDMRKIIEDSLPDASAGRSVYLRERIDRVLGEFRSQIGAVTLTLAREGADGPFVVQLETTPRRRDPAGPLPFVVNAKKVRLPDALAAVFNAAEIRLRQGSVIPRLAPRQPAA